MDKAFLETLKLTFGLASITTALLFLLGVPLAYRLAKSRSRLKPVWETLVSLPLVLPPSVLGFYLLLVFSPQSAAGAWLLQHLGLRLVFSFPGLVLGSILYSLPFMVQPVQAGFERLSPRLTEAAYTMNKSRFTTFLRVELPNIRPALLTGAVLSFAHTVGEFGVILMIGGNIPGETRVASIAVYEAVESLNYQTANRYALVLVVFSFLVLVGVYGINRRWRREGGEG
ncbi:MAG: molybdate ABC transporter permease subunit [Lewinella sp.]|nr:molybdate ABC transporter permease subunit [Lewinella sp.]